MKHLASTSDVIGALGGPAKVAELLGPTFTAKAVSNWRKMKFPAKTYLVLQAALKDAGCTAPASLWSIIEPPSPKPKSRRPFPGVGSAEAAA